LIRPYIAVSKIPNFDPTALPYWEIYEREGVADGIKVGGTMAGEFTAGLSGEQRKLLLSNSSANVSRISLSFSLFSTSPLLV
jgi:hypothetical protein